MADTKISALPAVTTATATDEYATNQGGTSKKTTRSVLFTNPEFPGYYDLDSIATPSVPGAGVLRVWGRATAGRMLLKWQGASGLDTAAQPALFGNNVVFFSPSSGTTVTNGFGLTWAKGSGAGTVSTPSISTGAPVYLNTMKRTRMANAVTTTNQQFGIVGTAGTAVQFWRGNAAGFGGFFFFTRFGLGAWLAGSRIFAGMAASATTPVVSDTLTNNCCGMSRLLADTGNTLSFVTRDATTTNTIAISGATIATGAIFDVYIFARPNDSTIYFRVDQNDDGSGTNLGTLIDSSTSTNLPVNTTLLGADVTMSNGTANITANTVFCDVNRIYVESDH